MRFISILAAPAALLLVTACSDTPTTDPYVLAPHSGQVSAQSIVQFTCAACHGADLHGASGPALSVVGEYTFAQFETLLCTGVTDEGAIGDAPMLGQTRSLDAGQRYAVYEYLRTWATNEF